MERKEEKILMAMSGGIDSSVAAILLREQGYQLEGATYRTYDQISDSCMAKEKGCCSVDAIFEARAMAQNMGFDHHILDIRKEFHDTVIQDFISEYLHGRTPNPCVVCNSTIKWGKLQEIAENLGCKYIATGHYARIGTTPEGRYFLRKGVDESKDQTYFLWKLTQNNLAHTIFPLGSLTKPEVRELAKSHGHEKLSKKSESQEICFIPSNDYRSFLRENVANFDNKYKGGEFVDTEGKILGKHQGFAHYTIGQRKGLQIALGEPRYVVNIDAKTNRVTLGKKEDLLTSQCHANQINLMKKSDYEEGELVMAKVRYKSKSQLARIYHESEDIMRLEFENPIESITPGQSVVLYTGTNWEDVLGGGVLL